MGNKKGCLMEVKDDVNQLYVLRLWRGQATGLRRATLKEVESGQTHHFVSMAALLAYLENGEDLSATVSKKT